MAGTPNNHDLEALMREFEASDLAEMHVKVDGLDLFLSKDPMATAPGSAAASPQFTPGPTPALTSSQAPAPHPSPSATQAAPANPVPAEVPAGCTAIRAPYLGTFYRAPKPGEPVFVEIGQSIDDGTDLCLVEVMKLFTAVRSTVKGKVREIYAADGQMVEEGQLLMAIETEG